ncbi:endolytic transglycosylase MltG, partial [Candidatus Peregrinibacteria bacterium]|nr:endolytic transglycosylase MltG [Candidatus Peregrinibacteria bacterium]
RGLPPGPIASPGLASVRAALHPKDSPYWYYLHDTSGVIHYAVTNDEHNSNKAQYLH